MSVLKWKKQVGNWISIYKDAIERRLKKDKNLSDLTDKAAARDNLEINGDNVTSHQHDSIYLPLINKEAAERKATDEEILNELSALQAKEDSSLKDLIQTLVDNETASNQKIANLNTQISDTETRLNNNINNATSKADIKSRTISVGGSQVEETSRQVGQTTSGGNYITSYENTRKTISGGTYNLTDLLTALVNASHTHKITKVTSECVLIDCDCNCRG